MRQLLPTGRLCFRAIFSISGRKRIAQRLIDEWPTDTLILPPYNRTQPIV
jgi:hypothetical protein